MNAVKKASLALATAATLAATSFPAQAVTLIGHDLSQATLPYDWSEPRGTTIRWSIEDGTDYDRRKAVEVTLAPGTSYSVDSFTAMIAVVAWPESVPIEHTHVAIYRDGGDRPGQMLASLGMRQLPDNDPNKSDDLVPASPVTWTAATPVVLAGGSTYWFALNDPTQNSGDESGVPFAQWTVMASGAAPAGVATLAGYRFSVDGGASWSASTVYNAIQIEATAVAAIPEPQTLAMMLAGLAVVGGIVSRRKAKQSQYM